MNNPSAVNSGEPSGSHSQVSTGLQAVTIGVDARTFQYPESISRGIGHYALHHLLAAIPLCPDWRFILFNDTGKPCAAMEPLLKLANAGLHSLEEFPYPPIDLFHIPDPMSMTIGFDSPLRLFQDVKSTVIFHDLIPLRVYWGSWDESTRQAYLLRLDQLRRRSARVLANSEFTRLDLIRGTGIPAERTHVIMAGLNRPEPGAEADPGLFHNIRKKHGITRRFFLHVGALDPHKNFETVIQAFGKLPVKGSAQLVVVGRKESYLKAIAAFVAKQKMADIIFTGFVARAELEALYQEAIALLFLSKYEGFGFPVLEAMAQGCPVITTNVTSIPEVAGDAAMMFDPGDATGISQAMQQLLNSLAKRQEYRRKGMERAAQFTWEKTARQTIAVWEKMLGISTENAAVNGNQAAPLPQAANGVPPVPGNEHRGVEGSCSSASSGKISAPANGKPVTPAGNAAEMGTGIGPVARSASADSECRPLKRGVVWYAPWQNPSGYCSEAFAFAQGIADSVPLEFVEVAKTKSPSFIAGLPPRLGRMLREHLKDQVNASGKIAILHLPGGGISHVPGAAYCIGRTMFETDQLPPDWPVRCNLMDEIWVPSKFNAGTFAASGVEPSKLVVMPQAADEEEFNPARYEPLPLPGRANFNFLSVFGWSARKGWDVLLAAYLREFSASDDVCLHLRTCLPNQPDGDPAPAIESRIRDYIARLDLGNKPLPRVRVIGMQIPRCDLPRLYKAADCLVAPSRGEGWGRPHHEAMLMELPVIATNWSGNTEFMNADNSYLLDYELVEASHLEAELWQHRGHRWANPSEKHLRELMRRVFENREEAIARGKSARRQMVDNFSIARVAGRVLQRLSRIEADFFTAACAPVKARSNEVPAATASHSRPVQVAWSGSFLDLGSLSHVNRELTRCLDRQPQIRLTCVGDSAPPPGVPESPVLRDMARSVQSRPAKGTQVTVCHAWPPVWRAPAAGAWVLMQPWEFGALPAEWVAQLARVDEVWVPSEFVRCAYVNSGVEGRKVKVVPNGVDPEKFHPGCAPMQLPTRKAFKFLFVGGTIYRKGPDVLLDSYLKSFTAADDVCLVIKDFGGKTVYAGQTFQNQIKAAQAQPGASEILHLTTDISPEAIPGLYAACDCLAHPYRGEGFGLPVLEAMACGLPVIVTAGGSTDDFADDAHAWRIPSRRRSIGGDLAGMKLSRDGWLLEPDPAALCAQMKWIVNNPDAARARGRAAAEFVRREWSWERAAQIAGHRLHELVARKQAQSAPPAKRDRAAQTIALPATAKIGNLFEARECLRKNDLQAAWAAASDAAARRPFHCEAWLLLAEIARAAGDFKQARLCAGRAKELAPNWRPVKQFVKNLPAKPGLSRTWPALPETPAAPRLTVCLITKNEERFLAQCLKSVQGLAHQIVVLDTGSTDGTVGIAKGFGAEVHYFAWCDDFAAARNAALEHATGDWVLGLDADEELMAEHRQTILQEMRADGVMGYRLPILNKGREQAGRSFVPRLFRNAPGLFYVGRVHEQVFSSIEVRCRQWGLQQKLGRSVIFHHGYTKEVMESRDKIARNLLLLQRAIEDLPGEPNLVMNLGLELIRSGQFSAGLEKYREAYHLMSEQPSDRIVPELRETLLTQLTTHLLAAKAFAEVAELWDTPFAKSGGMTASHHFGLGLAYMELKRPADAAKQMRHCLAKRGQPALSPVNVDILKAGPNHCLALCLCALGRKEAAAAAFAAALADEPSSLRAGIDYARFQAGQGRPLEALKLLNSLAAENPGEAPVWQLGGEIALSRPEFLEFARDWTGEAVKQCPEHPGLMSQRAEALLLTGDIEGALPLWRRAQSPNPGRQAAAVVLCELLTVGCRRHFPAAEEAAVSRELVKWYRQLIAAGAHSPVRQLDGRMEEARAVAPGFVGVWEAATRKACGAMAAA